MRVDRKVDVFDADTEALHLFGYILECKSGQNIVANPAMSGDAVLEEANSLINNLNMLHFAIQQGENELAKKQNFENDNTKTKSEDHQSSEADKTDLKVQVEDARLLLEALNYGNSRGPD